MATRPAFADPCWIVANGTPGRIVPSGKLECSGERLERDEEGICEGHCDNSQEITRPTTTLPEVNGVGAVVHVRLCTQGLSLLSDAQVALPITLEIR